MGTVHFVNELKDMVDEIEMITDETDIMVSNKEDEIKALITDGKNRYNNLFIGLDRDQKNFIKLMKNINKELLAFTLSMKHASDVIDECKEQSYEHIRPDICVLVSNYIETFYKLHDELESRQSKRRPSTTRRYLKKNDDSIGIDTIKGRLIKCKEDVLNHRTELLNKINDTRLEYPNITGSFLNKVSTINVKPSGMEFVERMSYVLDTIYYLEHNKISEGERFRVFVNYDGTYEFIPKSQRDETQLYRYDDITDDMFVSDYEKCIHAYDFVSHMITYHIHVDIKKLVISYTDDFIYLLNMLYKLMLFIPEHCINPMQFKMIDEEHPYYSEDEYDEDIDIEPRFRWINKYKYSCEHKTIYTEAMIDFLYMLIDDTIRYRERVGVCNNTIDMRNDLKINVGNGTLAFNYWRNCVDIHFSGNDDWFIRFIEKHM